MENTLEIADLRAGFPTEKGVAMRSGAKKVPLSILYAGQPAASTCRPAAASSRDISRFGRLPSSLSGTLSP